MKSGQNTFHQPFKTSGPCLAERVVLFSRFLKSRGFKTFPSSIMDSLQCLEEISIVEKGDFFSVLRANLVTNDVEWGLFRELFEEFWQDVADSGEEEESEGQGEQAECTDEALEELLQEMTKEQDQGGDETRESGSVEVATYSPLSRIENKNFARIEKKDIQVAQLVLRNMLSPLKLSFSRRFKKSRRPGEMDFRGLLKKSLKTGGIPIELAYKKKKKRLKRLVILADVSGSMDRYARFVMPFLLGLRGVGTKAEVFVFSTSLTPITKIIRRFDIDEALERICRLVPDWSGGTRIGYSLHQFTQEFGEKLLNKRTVVLIMSDGWDLGGRDLLKREMETLSQKAHCVIWLNPLAGDTEYKPVCQGMQIALPLVDYFLPADSLNSLKKVGRVISKVMTH